MEKVIIAGGRDFDDPELMEEVMKNLYWHGCPGCDGWDEIEVVSGGARGADRHGQLFANNNLLPLEFFPANWSKYGPSAGPRRNAEMADYADALVAFWDGESSGTANMIQCALSKGLEVHVYRYEL